MLRRIRISIWALLALSLLAACGNSAGPAAPVASRATDTPAAPAAAAATSAPATARPAATTAASPPTAAAQPSAAAQAASIPEGVTAEGYHMLGNPNAPVTLTMYSDFL
jgi:protein-disulfide isomerase